jgi:osmotically-inducible protein OsmY
MANRYYDRESEPYGRRSYSEFEQSRTWRDRERGDRGWTDRAGDEVRSWFGDEDAERRRRRDERRSNQGQYDTDYDRSSTRTGYGRESDYGRGYQGGEYERSRGYGGSYGTGARDYEGERYGGYGNRGYESGYGRFGGRGYEGERLGGYGSQGYEGGYGSYGTGMGYGNYEGQGYGNYGAQGYSGISESGSYSSMSSPGNQSTMGQTYGGQTYGGQGYGYGSRSSEWGQGSSTYGGSQMEQGQYRGQHAGRGPQGYKRSDQRIEEDVNERLTQHGAIDASLIQVSVKDGEVTLNGTVESRMEKRIAEDVAEGCSGVKEVQNHLRVQQKQQEQNQGQTQSSASSTTSQTEGQQRRSAAR